MDFDADFIEEAASVTKAQHGHFDLSGFSAGFEAIAKEFPLLEDGSISIRVSRACGRHQEGTRLVCEGSRKNIILRIQTCRLFNHGFFQTFLRHCLSKAQDMVDPHFGYSAWADIEGKTPEENKQLNELFEKYWDESIGRRLGYEAHRIKPDKSASVIFFSSGENKTTVFKSTVTWNELMAKALAALNFTGTR